MGVKLVSISLGLVNYIINIGNCLHAATTAFRLGPLDGHYLAIYGMVDLCYDACENFCVLLYNHSICGHGYSILSYYGPVFHYVVV